jgi:uncharacterized protein (TIGR02391 family)
MKRKSAPKATPQIQAQEVITETGRRSYEILRLTRIRYQGNPYTFMDFRLFQRGFDDAGDERFYPTKKGIQIKEEDFQRLIGKWTLVPSMLFHPIIYRQAFPAFRREEFDTAVFKSYKAVEVQVRKRSGLPAQLVGTKLMRRAFDPTNGPLTNLNLPMAEREATAHLFAGAIGCYKNPFSHRDIETSFKEAFEMMLVASHLLQILDRIGVQSGI